MNHSRHRTSSINQLLPSHFAQTSNWRLCCRIRNHRSIVECCIGSREAILEGMWQLNCNPSEFVTGASSPSGMSPSPPTSWRHRLDARLPKNFYFRMSLSRSFLDGCGRMPQPRVSSSHSHRKFEFDHGVGVYATDSDGSRRTSAPCCGEHSTAHATTCGPVWRCRGPTN